MDPAKLNRKRDAFAKELRAGRSMRMIIKGTCMRPLMEKGDIVTIKPIDYRRARVGDIVVYNRTLTNDFTVHRLMQKRKDKEGKEYLFTKSDVNIYGDLPVYPEELYGKVVDIERKDGRIINLETTFNLSLAYLIVSFSWIFAVVREAIFSPASFLKRVKKRCLKK